MQVDHGIISTYLCSILIATKHRGFKILISDRDQSLIMSITEKQEAYHLRKMRSYMTRMDINKDGFLSREDYELMAKQLAEYGGLTEKQADSAFSGFMEVADSFNLVPGFKLPLQEAIQRSSKSLLSLPPEQRKDKVHDGVLGKMFDIIDTSKEGYLSLDEIKAFYKVIAPEMAEAEVLHVFEAVDTGKDGKINREEFITGAEDFLFGVKETELSKIFFGPLLD